jgi:alpha-beta hydrolase superfamily lysophospholipase
MGKLLGRMRARPWRSLGLVLLAAFVALNILAYRHARAMTHFVTAESVPVPRAESLSLAGKLGILLCGTPLPRPKATRTPADVGLDYAVETFAGDEGVLEAWHVGHPRPRGRVLLFHGYHACKAQLVPEARAFHELGYACTLVDFRGSGGSAGDRTTIGFREADDVARVVAEVRRRGPRLPLVLFGQSMGAAAVLRAVGVLGVEADAAVLECPFDRLLTAVRMRFRAMGVPSFLSAELLVFWGGVQHGFNGFRHNPEDDARGVACPALLLHGSADPRVEPDQVGAIYAHLAGRKELHSFAGLGHESFVAKKADQWKEKVRRFLREVK